jgi:hypothetical protein
MAGKGDTYRPVKKKVYDENFDQIAKKPEADGFKLVKVHGKLVQRKVYK